MATLPLTTDSAPPVGLGPHQRSEARPDSTLLARAQTPVAPVPLGSTPLTSSAGPETAAVSPGWAGAKPPRRAWSRAAAFASPWCALSAPAANTASGAAATFSEVLAGAVTPPPPSSAGLAALPELSAPRLLPLVPERLRELSALPLRGVPTGEPVEPLPQGRLPEVASVLTVSPTGQPAPSEPFLSNSLRPLGMIIMPPASPTSRGYCSGHTYGPPRLDGCGDGRHPSPPLPASRALMRTPPCGGVVVRDDTVLSAPVHRTRATTPPPAPRACSWGEELLPPPPPPMMLGGPRRAAPPFEAALGSGADGSDVGLPPPPPRAGLTVLMPATSLAPPPPRGSQTEDVELSGATALVPAEENSAYPVSARNDGAREALTQAAQVPELRSFDFPVRSEIAPDTETPTLAMATVRGGGSFDGLQEWRPPPSVASFQVRAEAALAPARSVAPPPTHCPNATYHGPQPMPATGVAGCPVQ